MTSSRILFLFCVLSSLAAANSARRFYPPTDVDSLLDAHPIALPAVKPAEGESPDTLVTVPKDTSAAGMPVSVFQIQLDALSDIDSAQARKAVLEQLLGGKINLVFDAPYYKLRFGNFATEQEAEDTLADLAGKNIRGFVVRE